MALSPPPLPPAVAQSFAYTVTTPTYGRIGRYDRTNVEADGVLTTTARLTIAVRLFGVVLHRESAVQTATWRGEKLVAFESTTKVNGKTLAVHGEARDGRFVVTTPEGVITGPADIVLSDAWSPHRLGPGTVVSVKSGKVEPITVSGGEDEVLMYGRTPVVTRHFHVNIVGTPDKWEVWQSGTGLPIRFRSIEKNAPVDFNLVSQIAGAATPAKP